MSDTKVFKGTSSLDNTGKKPKIKVTYINAKGKPIPLFFKENTEQWPYSFEASKEEHEVEVYLDNGLAKCRIPGLAPTFSETAQTRNKESANIIATAPYNFISYNVNASVNKESEPYIRFSGTIKCKLKCLTPLLVAGPSERSETKLTKKFIEINGKPVVPGSSLKGMLRSLVEIMSFSKMDLVGNDPIFWRDVNSARTSVYKQYFKQDPKIVNVNKDNTIPTGGFVKKHGANYYFTEAKVEQCSKYEKSSPSTIIFETGEKIYPKNPNFYSFTKIEGKTPELLKDEVVQDFLLQKEQAGAESQNNNWETYKENLTDPKKLGVPFFCIRDEITKTVSAIGFTKLFRLKYELTPKDIVGSAAPNDFTINLFGKADKDISIKGRVSVGMLKFDKFSYAKQINAPLLNPHPSCLAHYLVQDTATCQKTTSKTNFNSLKKYLKNDKPQLRGRKYYWHRAFEGNIDSENQKVQSTLEPIEKDSTGEFSIHLDKVSSIELGAILTALDLPKDCAHKLGTGKAIGLGSVRIDIVGIDVSSDSDRYSSISNRLQQFNKDNSTLDRIFIEKNKNLFKEYVVNSLTQKYIVSKNTRYEDLNAIKDLLTMMNFENKPRNEKTKNMPLDNPEPCFTSKYILKKIQDVSD